MNNHRIWLLIFLVIMSAGVLSAQEGKIIDLGIFKNPNNPAELEVRLRPAETIENGSYSAGIFTVRIPSSYGVALTEVPGSSPYGYSFAGPVGHAEGYDYYRFQFSGSVHFVNWEKGVEYPLLSLKVIGEFPRNARVGLVSNNEWTKQYNGDYYQELLGQELERRFYFKPLIIRDFFGELLTEQNVGLNWELENEELLAQSQVEHSTDGRNFEQLAKIPASVKPDGSEAYSFVHENPVNINFYRIRLVDINGEVTYSPVRVINLDQLDADFAVFPNPTPGPLTIASRNLNHYPDGVTYQLIDNIGRVVRTNQLQSENFDLDLSKLPGGIYFVTILSDEKQLDKFKVILANE